MRSREVLKALMSLGISDNRVIAGMELTFSQSELTPSVAGLEVPQHALGRIAENRGGEFGLGELDLGKTHHTRVAHTRVLRL